MIPNHRHQQVGGTSSTRNLWVPLEREIGIETDTDRVYLGRDSIPGGVPAFANSVQHFIRINGVHEKNIGEWLKGDYSLAVGDVPIGVVVETGADYYIIQLNGFWAKNDLPGNINEMLFLQDYGIAGTSPTGICIGIRIPNGMIISIAKAFESEILNDKSKFIDKLIEFEILEQKEGGGVMSLALGKDISVVPSLIHENIFEETPGGGVVAGVKETRIEILDTVNQGDSIILTPGLTTSKYKIEGDTPYLCASSEEFNTSDKIRVVFDGLEIEPGIDIFRESETQVSFNDVCVPGVIIFIFS